MSQSRKHVQQETTQSWQVHKQLRSGSFHLFFDTFSALLSIRSIVFTFALPVPRGAVLVSRPVLEFSSFYANCRVILAEFSSACLERISTASLREKKEEGHTFLRLDVFIRVGVYLFPSLL